MTDESDTGTPQLHCHACGEAISVTRRESVATLVCGCDAPPTIDLNSMAILPQRWEFVEDYDR